MTGLGLDIGSRTIKMVELKKGRGRLELQRKACVPNVSDIQLDLNQLVVTQRLKARRVVTAISGDCVFVRFMKILPVSKDKLCRTIEFEVEQQIPFPVTEIVWDYHIASAGIREGGELDVVAAAVKREKAGEFIAPLRAAGLRLDALDVVPFALYNCAYFNGELEGDKSTALINIGYNTTDVVLCGGGGFWARSFPIGIESKNSSGHSDDLIEEIIHSIEYYSSQSPDKSGLKIEEVIMSGEGAEGLKGNLSERLLLNARMLNPFKLISNASAEETEQPHIYSVAVGLALRQMSRAHLNFDLLKEDRVQVCEARQIRVFRIASALLLLAIIGCMTFFSRSDYNFKKVRLMRMGSLLETYRKYEPQIKELLQKRDAMKEGVKSLYSVIQKRDRILNNLSLISSFLTQDIWMTNFASSLSLGDGGKPCSISITGRSTSYKSVNDFIAALKKNVRFKNVRPISSSFLTDTANGGEELVEFSISMDIE